MGTLLQLAALGDDGVNPIVVQTVRRGCLVWGLASVLGCGPTPASPQPTPAPAAARSSCDEQVSRTLAEAEAAARDGYLDRSGRILEAGREACPSPRLVKALAEAWLRQGRHAAVARLLDATRASLAPALRASLVRGLAAAQKHPPNPDELLTQARQAAARGDHVTARQRYDQALARLSATLGEDDAPSLVFLDPATPHHIDDDYAGPATDTDHGELRLWPARDLEGRLGAAVAPSQAPDRPFRWFAGGAVVVAKGVVFADGAIRTLSPGRLSSSQVRPAQGWSRSPAGDVLLLDTDDAVEQLTLPSLRLVARVPFPGPQRSYRWLDANRVVVRSSLQREAAGILDKRRPGKVSAKVTGMLVAVAASGSHLAQVARDGKANVLSVVDGATGHELFRQQVRVTGDTPALTFSADGKVVVFVPGDATAEVFAIPSGRRRSVGVAQERSWHSVSSAAMSADGWVCVDARFAHWTSCELRAEVNIRGPSRAPPGYGHACFREAEGASVLLLPLRGQSAGRERVTSSQGPVTDLCARVKGPRFVAWLEGRESGEGSQRSTRDLVLVVWDPRARRVLRTIPLEGVAFDTPNVYGDLEIDGDLVHGQLGSFRFVADVAQGTSRVEPISPPEATVGFPLPLVEVSDAGFARSDRGAVIDVRTASTGTAPAGATWSTSVVTFQGMRMHLHDSHLRLDDPGGARLAEVTTFAKGFGVARFPDRQLELLGAKGPKLGCLFGDRVTELAVCEERYLTDGRYAGLFAK